MSIASYRNKVSRGVTGPTKPHCFPAGGELVSPNHSYPDRIYPYYDDFNDYFFSIPKPQRKKMESEYEEMLDTLFWPLGGLTARDGEYRRARTVIGLKRILHCAVEREDRMLIDINDCGRSIHTLGLLAIDGNDQFLAVGNHVPKRLQGFITPEIIAPCLHQSRDPHKENYPWSDSNITLLPAA